MKINDIVEIKKDFSAGNVFIKKSELFKIIEISFDTDCDLFLIKNKSIEIYVTSDIIKKK